MFPETDCGKHASPGESFGRLETAPQVSTLGPPKSRFISRFHGVAGFCNQCLCSGVDICASISNPLGIFELETGLISGPGPLVAGLFQPFDSSKESQTNAKWKK